MRVRVLGGVIIAAVMLFSQSAMAATVGVAVQGNGSAVQVGTTEFRPLLGGNAIEFYIPLSANDSGTFGTGGVGTSASSCNFFDPCGTGTLDMWVMYSPASLGLNTISITFEDLDLIGGSDPNGLLESLQVFNSAGVSLALIDSIADPEVVSAGSDTQQLAVQVQALNDPLWARLRFTAQLDGVWRATNTAEYFVTTLTPVPLPAALPLFGSGVAIMGFLGWWRKRRWQGKQRPAFAASINLPSVGIT